mmetsp:Transcript_5652/g.23485  ORF Transcript_5652/g.23485 Transcript_5652/m.23485 type:complete len:296 (-) Transcript_5652:645-1532(-)
MGRTTTETSTPRRTPRGRTPRPPQLLLLLLESRGLWRARCGSAAAAAAGIPQQRSFAEPPPPRAPQSPPELDIPERPEHDVERIPALRRISHADAALRGGEAPHGVLEARRAEAHPNEKLLGRQRDVPSQRRGELGARVFAGVARHRQINGRDGRGCDEIEPRAPPKSLESDGGSQTAYHVRESTEPADGEGAVRRPVRGVPRAQVHRRVGRRVARRVRRGAAARSFSGIYRCPRRANQSARASNEEDSNILEHSSLVVVSVLLRPQRGDEARVRAPLRDRAIEQKESRRVETRS